MKKNNGVKRSIIFAKLLDVNMDVDGNIHVSIKKDKIATSERTVLELRKFIDKDCTFAISQFHVK